MQALDDILARKANLGARIAAQRDSLGVHLDDLQPLFTAADQGIAAVQAVRAYWPWLGMGLIAARMLSRRRSLDKSGTRKVERASMATLALLWLRRSMMVWRTGIWVKKLISDYRQQAH